MNEIPRKLENKIIHSLSIFPVVYLAGPRKSGKTTLIKRIASTRHKAKYITFDDIQFRSNVEQGPDAFLNSIKSNVVLDEAQIDVP